MISILVAIVLVGVLLYLVHAVIPMDPKIRTILDVVVVLCLCVWLLRAFGVTDLGLPR